MGKFSLIKLLFYYNNIVGTAKRYINSYGQIDYTSKFCFLNEQKWNTTPRLSTLAYLFLKFI